MADATFDLAMVAKIPTWYNYLPQVEAAMCEQDRIDKARWRAGWDADEGGWYSPCGISEFDWEHEYGYPFPEEPGYEEWASAFYHYDKVDALS